MSVGDKVIYIKRNQHTSAITKFEVEITKFTKSLVEVIVLKTGERKSVSKQNLKVIK